MPKANQGYTKELLVLPFDHRTSFVKKMLGITTPPNEEQHRTMCNFKMMIFEGFEKAVSSGLPKEKMGILADEQFGTDVLKTAKTKGFTVCLCTEKSGQPEFDFEYGSAYAQHIEKFSPDFVKVLVRYNPEDNVEMNQRQATRLAELSQYLDRTQRKYIFELLVPASEEQLKKCNNDKSTYDIEMRPSLMSRAIQELHRAGVEADVWKLEGLDREEDCKMVCETTREGGRNDVGVIILGRGENDDKVRHWLTVGAKVPGVIGFAVGRTVFLEALKGFHANKFTREEAVSKIAESYGGFCRHWLAARA